MMQKLRVNSIPMEVGTMRARLRMVNRVAHPRRKSRKGGAIYGQYFPGRIDRYEFTTERRALLKSRAT
jgi:hypothetical protein